LRTAEVRRLDAAIHRLVLSTREGADHRPPLILVTVPRVRRPLARLLHELDRDLPVLSFPELETELNTEFAGLVPRVLDEEMA
jgi:flagellar biosynthesis component FlhA